MAGREKSVIYEDLLRNNIIKIEHYLSEENSNLNDQCKLLKNSLEDYKSDTNSDLMLNEINKFEDTLEEILKKRNQYVDILEKVIILYNNLKTRTTNKYTELGKIEEK